MSRPTTLIESKPQRKPADQSKEQNYAKTVLENAVQKIEKAPNGEKHNSRLRLSRLIGGYAASGLLNQEQALSDLIAAAQSNTTDPKQAEKDVRDGFCYGMQSPLVVTPCRDQREFPNKSPCDTSNSEINHAKGLDELRWHHRPIGKDRNILFANICNVQQYLRQNHAEI